MNFVIGLTANCFYVNFVMAQFFTPLRRTFCTSSSFSTNIINHVTIVGGGLMGSGIAQVTAQSGMNVTIIEVNDEAMKKSEASIKNSIQRVAKKLFQNNSSEAEQYIEESLGRLKISTDLNDTVSKTDLVVEAIVENMEAKHRLFGRIDSIAPEHTIFASNTSSLSIQEIAAVTSRKDRFGGLHFFNPVPVMKLLEVIRTEDTSDDTYQKMMAWGKAIGKTTITCKDTPGFVVNRLLIPYLAEAMRMLERGDATAKDIDIAMKLGAGYPMGPFELLDYVGLDTTKFILDGWHRKAPSNALFAPTNLLDKMVSQGKLGKKTGEGFYSYKKSPGTFICALHAPYIEPLPATFKSTPPLQPLALPEDPKIEKVKKVKKAESVEKTNKSEAVANLLSMEKMKRSNRLKIMDRWRNTEEYIKHKSRLSGKRSPSGKKQKMADIYPGRDIFRTSEKLRNFEEFIRSEKERDFKMRYF